MTHTCFPAHGRSGDPRSAGWLGLAAKGLFLASLIFAPGAVYADTLTFTIDQIVGTTGGGTQNPTTNLTPTVTATVTDTGPNQVTISVTNSYTQASNNRITQVAFNIDPFSSPTPVSSTPSGSTFSSGLNNQTIGIAPATPQTGFDLLLSPVFSSPSTTFTYVVTNITSPAGLNSAAQAFNATNASGYYAMAFLQGQNASSQKNCVGSNANNFLCTTTLGTRIAPAGARPRSPIPGPLPILGAAMAFTFSRRLRSRVNAQHQLGSTHPSGALVS